MSWFDTSSFSSFAKTALSQAQNLQKSIDRVLDIEDDRSSSPSRLPPGASKQESPSPSVSPDSTNKSSLTRNSSSSSSMTALLNSSRKSSSGVLNSKENNSTEGSSFWSSFVGDSLSTATTNNDSNTSSHRVTGRKPSPRVSGTVGGRKGRESGIRKKSESLNNATDREEIFSATESEKQKSDGIDFKETSKSPNSLHMSGSYADLLKERVTGSEDTPDKTKQSGSFDISEVGEDNPQESTTPAASNLGLDLKSTKIISDEETSKGQSEEPNINVLAKDSDTVHSSMNASSVNGEKEKPVPSIDHKDPPFVSSRQYKIPETYTVTSCAVKQSVESENMAENRLETIENKGSIDDSQSNGDIYYTSITCNNLATPRNHGSPDVDTVVTQGVSTFDNPHELLTEYADPQRIHDVTPVASSTPNCHSNKWLHKESKTEETNLNDGIELQEELHKVNIIVSLSDFEGNDGTAASETEVIVQPDYDVKQGKQLDDFKKLENSGQVSSLVEETQHPAMINESVVVPEEIEKRKHDVEENSTENMDQLKNEIKELQTEVRNLQHVVEVRENKLVQLSKDNFHLQETTNILRSQLKQAEAALKTDDEEIEEVRREFTVRVAATETKFKNAAKERDKFKALLDEREKYLNSRNEQQIEEFTELLKQKDDQIAQLLEEGEKLSKQELQVNNAIKKLRAKDKENEAIMKKNSEDVEVLTSENTRLNEILEVKEANERKQAEAITKLNSYVEKQEEKVAKLNSELDDGNAKLRSMQTALDNAYKQLADLHKENASKDSAVQEAALSAEMTAKEGLRVAMEKKERHFKKEIETLEFQISDLQTSLHRNEQQGNRREDNLRQEISDVQQRLQEAEARNQELTESVTRATRPLLRQIENLQSSYGNHTQTWERVERNLTERLNDAQLQLAEAQEKERVATEHALQLNSRLTAVESQLVTYRQDKSRLEATLEVERAKQDTVEDARSREAARAEALEIKYRKMMEDSNVEKVLLEQQLAVEKSKMETEKKRFQNAMDEKERTFRHQSANLSGVPPSPSSVSGKPKDDLHESSPHSPLLRQNSSSSIIDGLSRGFVAGSTAMVERLQAHVKQKDGEIELLQEEIQSLQKTRDSLTEDLTHLTSRMENFERNSGLLNELQVRHKELEQRHNAVLQMYGEKAEECDELRMDLEDVKSMYKSQIQELLGASR